MTTKRVRLAQVLAERNISRLELGIRSHVHPALLGQIASGRAVPPRDSVVLARIAAALDFAGDPGELIDVVSDDDA